jgi:two-component system, chemotaxis family, CheB/CheR fusion protein
MDRHKRLAMSSEHNELFVIGIGSSAGGLESLCLLVSSLPVECPCAYIIAQHTSPSHRSMLADILSRDSKLEVRVLTDGEKIQKGKVFVIPPGKNAVIKDGYIRLTDTIPEVSPKPSINTLFESIAEQFREMGFGIILSGTGADGARGIRAIKASGGVAFVQSPESAKYDGMPRSAIEAVQVDCIIPPEKMGPAIGRFVGFPAELLLEPQTDRSPEMSILFDRVLSQTNIDFSSYKQSTVLRRLHRRIMATDSRDIKSYIDYIDAFPEELQLFAKEALISVTKFFRDKESFSTLRSCIDELVKSKEKGADFRVWVAGCATGEEAYSIAISFIESMRSRDDLGSLTVFATDIDTNALDVARRGIYSYAAVSELPSDLLNRYFRASETSYRPIKSLRDSITFSRQDMTCDPPFMRLDFVSCRNVLIYFNQSLQAQVLSIFRYALRENGVLFLGRSETVSQNEPCFDTLDRQHRIYRSIGDSRPNIITLPSRVRSRDRARSLKDGRDTHHNEFIQALLDTCQPSILIDSGLRIIHLHGHLSDFIDIKSRNTETILSKVITSEFTSELVTTVGRARRQNTLTYSRTRRIKSLDNQPFRMVVKPIEGRDRFLLSFEKVQKASETDKAYEDVAQNSAPDDEELKSVREQNLSLIQELATSSEQLQALNEEMQASNEELQATNEELEATNEELAATNEELISVNEEAMRKSVELSILNAEFESVFNIIEFPIIVFNDDMTVSRANESARHMYMLEARSIGSHVSDLSLPPYLAGINRAVQF